VSRENGKNPAMKFAAVRVLLNPESDPGLSPSDVSQSSAPAPAAGPQTAPESTATKNPDHDDDPAALAAPKAGLGERLRKKVGRVFNFRKGKGRPKKCRECNGDGCEDCEFTGVEPGLADRPGDDAGGGTSEPGNDDAGPGAPPAHPENPPVADSPGGEIFIEACGAGVETALDLADTVTLVFAEKAGFDAEFSEKALAKVRPDQKKIDRFGKCLKGAFREQNIEVKNPCTKAAIINGLGLFTGYGRLIRMFMAEAARRRREGK
jgi:hypothetical protein